ncbi:MAG: M1 family peptidase, partial [Deltaproteobacteria bacterium]|nr:M1 family peptidase [Deltaproteobacteria bacterium]
MSRQDPHSYTDTDQGRISKLELDLDVDFEARKLRGAASLTLAQPASGPLDLDTRDLVIDSITGLDGAALEWQLADAEDFMGSRLRVELPEATAGLKIAYATGETASALQWLEPQQTAGGEHPFLFSQCQAIHARSMVPIQDSPGVRFAYTAEISVPDPLTAVMSAAPGGRVETAAAEGRAVFSFSMPQPIPAYLLALAVGNLSSKDLGPRSRVYAEPETLEAAAWEFDGVDSMLQSAETIFGPYLWDRFDFLVMPPAFPYGGMENPRLTFLTPTLMAGDRSLVNVLIHELAHSWTGNLVTNASMNHFWLNEGFTVWAERRILEKLEGEEAVALSATIGRTGLQGELDRFGEGSPLTRLETDLTGTDPDEVFSLVPYEKGFLFVSLLERTAGRERFDKFLLDYIERFKFESITTADFEKFIEEKLPGVLAEARSEEWIRAAGVPDNTPVYESAQLGELQKLAAGMGEGKHPDPAALEGWGAEEWQIFLQGVPNKLSADDCKWLDETFGLTKSK